MHDGAGPMPESATSLRLAVMASMLLQQLLTSQHSVTATPTINTAVCVLSPQCYSQTFGEFNVETVVGADEHCGSTEVTGSRRQLHLVKIDLYGDVREHKRAVLPVFFIGDVYQFITVLVINFQCNYHFWNIL